MSLPCYSGDIYYFFTVESQSDLKQYQPDPGVWTLISVRYSENWSRCMNSDLSQIFWKLNKTQWDRQIARWAQSEISYSDLIDGHAVLQWVRQNSSKTRPWGVWLQQMAHASYCLSEIGKPVISTRQTDQSVSLQSKKKFLMIDPLKTYINQQEWLKSQLILIMKEAAKVSNFLD